MRRLPVYILVDCSASMRGEAIEAVKVGLDKLLSSLRRDPYALEGVYVSLIAYSNDADVLVTLTELSDFQLPAIALAESSNRNLGQAIELLCQRYDEEVRKTTSEQKGDWLPFVVMLTGGDPDDEEHIEQILPQLQEHPFAKIIACVAGADKSTRVLRSFTKDIFLLDTMNSHSFSRFWQWVSKITSVQSRSLEQFQEELPPPPPEFNPFYSVNNVAVENAAVETAANLESPPVKKVETPVETLTKPSIDIFQAIERNDLATVQQWLKIDAALINVNDNKRATPLHHAVLNNFNVDIIKYLISQGANVNAKSTCDWTPLHSAAIRNPNVEIIKYLISQGADINAKCPKGNTPLHHAIFNSFNVEIIKYLISQGADVNVKDESDWTPLHYAASNNPNVEITKYLISQGADINAKSQVDNTPLHYAAFQNSNVEITKYLISKGANVKAQGCLDRTPLYLAAYNNSNVEVLQYLISQGADINVRDQVGYTPLYGAAWHNPNIEVLKYLISQGADINAKDNNNQTPLDVADTEEKKQILRNASNASNSPPPTSLPDGLQFGGTIIFCAFCVLCAYFSVDSDVISSFIPGLAITGFIGIFIDIFIIKLSGYYSQRLYQYWLTLFKFSILSLTIFGLVIMVLWAINYDIASAWLWFLCGIITGLSAIMPFSIGHVASNYKSKP